MIHVPYIYWENLDRQDTPPESPSPLTSFNSRITCTDLQYLSQSQIRETPAISHNSFLTRSRIARFRNTTRLSMRNKPSQSFSMR